ncbi:MAG: anti-sigma regulatory factor [Paludibacter sp.]|nr:anti-sigma regulatory factor [Paludibacter sp.]
MLEIVSDKSWKLLETCPLKTEFDIVKARQIVRQFAKEAGMGIVDQTRITTAVSELFRNMYMYGGGGEVLVESGIIDENNALIITCIDKGPGIEDIDLAMTDGFSSGQGMGYGLPGAKRLVDRFEMTSEVNKGTTIRVMKWK